MSTWTIIAQATSNENRLQFTGQSALQMHSVQWKKCVSSIAYNVIRWESKRAEPKPNELHRSICLLTHSQISNIFEVISKKTNNLFDALLGKEEANKRKIIKMISLEPKIYFSLDVSNSNVASAIATNEPKGIVVELVTRTAVSVSDMAVLNVSHNLRWSKSAWVFNMRKCSICCQNTAYGEWLCACKCNWMRPIGSGQNVCISIFRNVWGQRT